jgi:hypothetical protein
MDNVIRPTFGSPRRAPEPSDPRVQVTTERVYGEANGYRVCLVRDDEAQEGEIFKVVVGLVSGMEVSTVAILPATDSGAVDAELIALAILRTLGLIEGAAEAPEGV